MAQGFLEPRWWLQVNLCLQHAGRRSPLQPARSGGGDAHTDLRLPRRETNLHQSRREAKFNDENVHASLNSVNERLQQEMEQLESRAIAPLRVLQLL